MSGPSGDFVFTTPAGPDVLMVAGGVGIAPIIGLLRRSLEAGHTTTLITANREHSYLAGDLHRLAGEHPDLQIVEVLSRPPASWTGPTGRISTTLVGELLSGLDRTGRGADWYICGSPGFCDTARASAQSLGARRIHEEPFTQAIDPPPAPRFQARVRFNDRRTVVVKQGQTILAAALESGIQLPHSCMSGTCRECVCTVRAGSAVQGARPMEAGEGERILTCVAYPVEPDGLELETAETTEQQNSF
jgi:ring-1,2-phenylacetyl-CoA epoxidase subunit PaaE